MPEPSDYLAEFRDRLVAMGLEPVVIGAMAAIRYRLEPRTTADVDFLVLHLAGVDAALIADGYEVRLLAEPGQEPYAAFIRREGVQVDLIRAETSYQREALSRAIDGFLSPEDVIVHKLIAWRPRDRDDIESILATGRPLDVAYIDRWATAWDVLDRWLAVRS